MKKILAFAMVLGVLGSIVGCGNSDSSAPAEGAGTTAGTAATPAADSAAKTTGE